MEAIKIVYKQPNGLDREDVIHSVQRLSNHIRHIEQSLTLRIENDVLHMYEDFHKEIKNIRLNT